MSPKGHYFQRGLYNGKTPPPQRKRVIINSCVTIYINIIGRREGSIPGLVVAAEHCREHPIGMRDVSIAEHIRTTRNRDNTNLL